MYRPDRRRFLKTSTLGASAALMAGQSFATLAFRQHTTTSPDKRIIKRKLGRTGLELPVVSMGVMRADNPALPRAALEAGMVHLDTAHGYQKGKNEQMLGEVLKEYPRESFVIATKIPPEGKESFLAKLDLSLERLQMKYTDILYLHGISSRDGILDKEMLETLKAAKDSGKARHIGASTHKNEPEVIRAAVESGVLEVVLTSINFKQDHYEEMRKAIAEAANAGIGIVAMKTMAGAFLDKEKTKPVNCLAALKWVLQDENVTTAIPGITSFDQLTENAGVNYDIALNEKEKQDLAEGKSESGLYCQGCDECTRSCIRNLPIPDIMRAYMYTYGYRDAGQARTLLAGLGLRDNPCESCVDCPIHCPKGFRVNEKIADVTRLIGVPEEFLG